MPQTANKEKEIKTKLFIKWNQTIVVINVYLTEFLISPETIEKFPHSTYVFTLLYIYILGLLF